MSETKFNPPPPTDRYNPLIRPTDEALKITEHRFQNILSNPTVRIQQILDHYFTPHERKLFLPATQPRSLRECQEDNTRRYYALFEGRFKGHHPSLATKFTMLYFGLPVEPVLSHLVDQGKPIFDVHDWEELHEAEVCPPLHFLTAHDRRNFGHDHMRGTEAHYSTIPIPASQLSGAAETHLQGSDSQSVNLRGGGPADEDEDDPDDQDDDQDMPDLEEQHHQQLVSGPGLVSKAFGGNGNASTSSLPTFAVSTSDPDTGAISSSIDTLVPLFGFQGRVSFNLGDLSTLEDAIRKLLSLKKHDHSDLVLAHISRNRGQIERSFETTTHASSNFEVAQYVDQQKSNPDCVWFVHRKGETTPTLWAPTEADFLTHLVRLRHVDARGQESVAYLSMPPARKFFQADIGAGGRWPSRKPWGINQYMPFLTTAQEVLVGRPNNPGENNCDLVISTEPGASTSHARPWFGGLEIDHDLWGMMHPRCNERRPFTVTSHSLDNDSIVFYLPGSLTRPALCSRREGPNDPYPDARRTLEMFVKSANIPLTPSHYRIWRGTDFFNSSTIYPAADRRPVRWNHLDVSAEQRDQESLSKFIQDAVNDAHEPCRFFVVQPVDGDEACRLGAADVQSGPEEDFTVDTHRINLFKSKVRSMYEGQPETTYEPEKDYILIEPVVLDRLWKQSQFILSPDASDNELVMIRRLIVAAEVRVTVLKDDAADYVKQLEKSDWGPRYGEVTRFRRELGLPVLLPQPIEHFVRPPNPQKIPKERSREPRKEPRETTWSQQPSVFDRGVYNPSIPINAPPVEQIMRMGGARRLPMVTKAVLTSTEQRQLQHDLWTLRGMVLNRLSRCPYGKCRFTYRLDQEDEFLKHLQKSHVGNKCPWCSEQLFAHWSTRQKEHHFKAKHAEAFRKILDMPQSTSTKMNGRRPAAAAAACGQTTTDQQQVQDLLPTSTIINRVRPPTGPLPGPSPPAKANWKETEYRFCDRCGRDHHTLNDKTERDHHDRRCVPLAEGAGRCTFCETCGDHVWNAKNDRDELAPYDDFPHRCRGTSHANKPHCIKCGFSLRKLPDDDAVDRHREHCGGFYGDLGCFCPYCQKSFVQDGVLDQVDEIKKHVTNCSAKQPPNISPFDIYPESYWKNNDDSSDDSLLRLGKEDCNNALVFQLWDILYEKASPRAVVEQEPFGPGHSLGDPDSEKALDQRDKRCPYFEACGAMVGFMSHQQWNRHMESAHASVDFVGGARLNLDVVLRAADEERRRQRMPEGKQPIPGTTGKPPPGRLVPGGSGTETQVGTCAEEEGSEDSPQQPGTWTEPMEGVEPETPHATREGRGNGIGGQTGDNFEGHSSQPPKTQPRPLRPMPVPATTTSSTTKPPRKNKPKRTKLVPVPGCSTSKPDFVPDDDMYCSRCFRKAPRKSAKASRIGDPDRQSQLNAHSDPKRSCRIPPQQGQVKYNNDGTPQLPSRVGWIKRSRKISFLQLKQAFLAENPQLEKTMCPTDQSRRTLIYWKHDPNNDENSENWGLPFPGYSDDEDDGDDDHEDNGDDDDDDDDDDKDDEDKGGKEEGKDENADGNRATRRRRKRRAYRGPRLPRDDTYQDNGEEDDLSQANPSELVPESSDEGSTTGGKRRRNDADPAQKDDQTPQVQPKRPKVIGEQRNRGEGEGVRVRD